MATFFFLSLCLSACANGNYENEEFIDKEISSESTETSEASGSFSESEQTENDCSIIMGDLTISLNEYGEEIEEKETEKVFQSWQEAYLDVLYHLLDNLAPQYEPNGTDLRLDDYASTDIRIYLGLHDFDNDGMEELIAGDTLGIAVFTYKEGRVEKIADLYDPNSMWCVDGFYFKDNSISLDSDGAGGADYVNFGYLDNEYVLGIYNELCPDYGVIINGHEGTLEEMNRIYSTDWRDRESNIESDLKEWISLVKENQEWYLIYQSGEKVLLNSEFDFDSILW
jgi:hypothetical protein